MYHSILNCYASNLSTVQSSLISFPHQHLPACSSTPLLLLGKLLPTQVLKVSSLLNLGYLWCLSDLSRVSHYPIDPYSIQRLFHSWLLSNEWISSLFKHLSALFQSTLLSIYPLNLLNFWNFSHLFQSFFLYQQFTYLFVLLYPLIT